MRDGYRWLDAAGGAISPRHRSIDTAARWLGRQARVPRVRPRPALLLAEQGKPGEYVRRRVLTADERARLAELLPQRVPLSVERWTARLARTVDARRRRRAGLQTITSRLAAHHPDRKQVPA